MKSCIRKLHLKKPFHIFAALLVCMAAAAGVMVWYYWHITKTPAYSIELIQKSIETHDSAAFQKHVDVDSILSDGYDDLMAVVVESDGTIKPESKTMVLDFSRLLKMPVVAAFKDGILHYVETGEWDEVNSRKSKNNPIAPEIHPEILADKTGLQNTQFLEIIAQRQEGDRAFLEINVQNQESEEPFPLQLQMDALEDGSWRVAAVTNAKEYLTMIAQAKQQALNDYIKATAPLVKAHETKLSNSAAKLKTIDTALLDANAKTAARQEIWQNEILPAWNEYAAALDAVNAPKGANELCQLRAREIDLRRQYAQKQLEWLQTKNLQTEIAMKTLNQQANEINYRIGNIILHAEE